jgi:hypothetical protein
VREQGPAPGTWEEARSSGAGVGADVRRAGGGGVGGWVWEQGPAPSAREEVVLEAGNSGVRAGSTLGVREEVAGRTRAGRRSWSHEKEDDIFYGENSGNVGDAHFIRAPKAQDPQCRLRFYECGEGVSLKVVPFR